MAATADSSRRTAFSPRAEDIIPPGPAGRVCHFRPVLSGGGIIDAEYEEIAATSERQHAAVRRNASLDGRGCAGIFGRHAVGSRKKGSAGFTAATVALSLLSFWVSGGHAAVTRLFVFAQR